MPEPKPPTDDDIESIVEVITETPALAVIATLALGVIIGLAIYYFYNARNQDAGTGEGD